MIIIAVQMLGKGVEQVKKMDVTELQEQLEAGNVKALHPLEMF